PVPDGHHFWQGGEGGATREFPRRDTQQAHVGGLDVGESRTLVPWARAAHPHGHVPLRLEVQERGPVSFAAKKGRKEQALVIAVPDTLHVHLHRETRACLVLALVGDRLDEHRQEFCIFVLV